MIAPAKFSLAVDAVVFDGNKLLTIKRQNEPFKDLPALPGGFVDRGETLQEAVARELKEETSLVAAAVSYLGVYDAADRDPRFRVISHVYIITRWTGTAKAGDDAKEIAWIDADNTGKMAFDHEGIVLEARAITNLLQRSSPIQDC